MILTFLLTNSYFRILQMKALHFISWSWSFDVRRSRHISGVFNLPNGTSRAGIILDGPLVQDQSSQKKEIVFLMWKVAFAKSQKCRSQFRKSNTGQLPWKHISQFMNTKERNFYLGNLILSHLQISIIFQQKGVNLQNIHIKFWLTNRATTKVKISKK